MLLCICFIFTLCHFVRNERMTTIILSVDIKTFDVKQLGVLTHSRGPDRIKKAAELQLRSARVYVPG